MGWFWAIIGAIIVGAIVGWAASSIMKVDLSVPWMIVTGIVGGFIGSWLLPIFGLTPTGGFSSWIWQWVTAIIGAIILLWVVGAIKKNKTAA